MKKEFACFLHCFIEGSTYCEAFEGKKLVHHPKGQNHGVSHFYQANTVPMKRVSKACMVKNGCMNESKGDCFEGKRVKKRPRVIRSLLVKFYGL
ncbi:MAG: hypothetical protein VXX63_04860 [Bacteroidota bacterium]|nr:hypothetical protein [Bacteroidota bacterium]